jgi:CelD/BcsL family acetyltransferase involved in cellulose biosynthesis
MPISGKLDIRVHRRMDRVEAQWRALEAHDINSLHHGWDWCTAWIDAYRRPVMIIEGILDGETAFLLPLEIVRGRMFTRAQFIGSLHANVNTGLLSPAFLDRATPDFMTAVASAIRQAAHGVDCILLSNVPTVWRGRQMPFAMLPFVENQNHAFALAMKPTFTETLAQLSAKRRRKKYSVGHRRLEALGGYRHVIAETAEEKDELVDLFYRQKGARLAEFGLPNVFACPMTQRFFRDIAHVPARDNDYPLRLHAIRMTGGELAGEVPAIAGVSRKGDHLIVQFSSIGSGPSLEASPGELLFHLMVEHYNGEPGDRIALFDFGIGDLPFKRAWCTQVTVQVNVSIAITQLGRLAALKEEAATRLKTVIKQNPAVYSLVQKIRARAHSGPANAAAETDRDED